MGSQEVKKYIPPEIQSGNYQVLSVNGDIDASLATKFIDDLEEIAIDENKIIIITVDSNGGSTDPALDMSHAIKRVPNVVKTLISRKANSSATLISASGTKGERYAWEGAEGLIHLPAAILDMGRVNVFDAVKKMSTLRYTTEQYLKVLQKVTEKSQNELLNICLEDRYLTSQEMLELNIIDHIISLPESKSLNPQTTNGFSENGIKHLIGDPILES